MSQLPNEEITRDKVLRVLASEPLYLNGWHWVNPFLFKTVKPEDIESDEPRGDIERWSTYSECVNLKVQHFDKELQLDYTVWDGDMFTGDPKRLRFEWSCRIPTKYWKAFQSKAAWKLRRLSEEAWEQHVRDWQLAWQRNF